LRISHTSSIHIHISAGRSTHSAFYHWRPHLSSDCCINLEQSAGVGPVVSVVARFPQQTENRTFCPVLQSWLTTSHCTDYYYVTSYGRWPSTSCCMRVSCTTPSIFYTHTYGRFEFSFGSGLIDPTPVAQLVSRTLFDRATAEPACSFIRLYWHQISFVLLLYGQRINTHLTDPLLGLTEASRWWLTIAPTRRSSSALLEKEAVDSYPYAWVKTGEKLAPRRFSSQNFYVPGVKLGVEVLVNRVFLVNPLDPWPRDCSETWQFWGVWPKTEPTTSSSGEVDLDSNHSATNAIGCTILTMLEPSVVWTPSGFAKCTLRTTKKHGDVCRMYTVCLIDAIGLPDVHNTHDAIWVRDVHSTDDAKTYVLRTRTVCRIDAIGFCDVHTTHDVKTNAHSVSYGRHRVSRRVQYARREDVEDEVRRMSASGLRDNTIQYNEKFALKNWQTHCQFNLAHKLKRTELFKRKMKWQILRIEIVLNVKLTKIRKMNEVKTTKIRKKTEKVRNEE